jgi:hypothetical protein
MTKRKQEPDVERVCFVLHETGRSNYTSLVRIEEVFHLD